MEYRILRPAGLRARYATLTDELIVTIQGAADGWRPGTVVFLDKSGRPVSWLVRALWPVLAREPGTAYADVVVPAQPAHRFVNIDREQWWDLTGATETGAVDVGRVPGSAIASLRAVFLAGGGGTLLDGASVLVVDEVSNTGDTLRIAAGLFARAFPSARIRTAHWMTPGLTTDRSGLRRTAEVPVWYRSDTWTGRLVGNRLDPAARPLTRRSRDGALFLSTRPAAPDQRGIALRREVGRLAEDVRAGRLLARPASSRDIDDWADRVQALYGYTDLRQFTSAREAQDRQQ